MSILKTLMKIMNNVSNHTPADVDVRVMNELWFTFEKCKTKSW